MSSVLEPHRLGLRRQIGELLLAATDAARAVDEHADSRFGRVGGVVYRERLARGTTVSDPTADVALDPHRTAISDACRQAERELAAATAALRAARAAIWEAERVRPMSASAPVA